MIKYLEVPFEEQKFKGITPSLEELLEASKEAVIENNGSPTRDGLKELLAYFVQHHTTEND